MLFSGPSVILVPALRTLLGILCNAYPPADGRYYAASNWIPTNARWQLTETGPSSIKRSENLRVYELFSLSLQEKPRSSNPRHPGQGYIESGLYGMQASSAFGQKRTARRPSSTRDDMDSSFALVWLWFNGSYSTMRRKRSAPNALS
ncbi:hypothetical protein M422DRAFT_42005 [Sphaerobolus stellatus SS14]|nr:hypothetical protein M422DRAFT_42005 [Sphaerobolus stellatus SS14]